MGSQHTLRGAEWLGEGEDARGKHNACTNSHATRVRLDPVIVLPATL
jgi:hypothetical protein